MQVFQNKGTGTTGRALATAPAAPPLEPSDPAPQVDEVNLGTNRPEPVPPTAPGKKRVVILGAGFAGIQMAKRLGRRQDLDVVLVDQTNHHLFQPLLYQVATGALAPSEISTPVRSMVEKQDNLTPLMATVSDIDLDQQTVSLDDGESQLSYDFLALAMGGKTNYFGHDEWETHAPGLKTLDDAVTIRKKLVASFEKAEKCTDPAERQRLLTTVIVGAGPTGVELAGAVAELKNHVLTNEYRHIDPSKARIIVVDGADRALGAFRPDLSDYATQKLEDMGVELRFNEFVQSVEQGKVTTSQATYEGENVLWAAGVVGHPLANQTGAPTDRGGRLKVESDLRLPGRENVYCLGDMAHVAQADGKPLPGLAAVAADAGNHAAKNLMSQLDGGATQAFEHQSPGTMAIIGRGKAIAELPWGLTLKGVPAWLGWVFVHVLKLGEFQDTTAVTGRTLWNNTTWNWNNRITD